MANNRSDLVRELLGSPDMLLQKKPFLRGTPMFGVNDPNCGDVAIEGETRRAVLPDVRFVIVTQDRFLKEIDPYCHEIMFDENIPSICVKLRDGGYSDIQFKRMPLNFQQRIREKQTLTMCGNPRLFSLHGADPSEEDKANFATIKEYWADRNQDGMTTKAVYGQLGLGDIGLLYYYDYKGRIKSRIISYEDGYVIVSHDDRNGDRLLECVYYADQDGTEHIDCYDDTNLYRLDNTGGNFAVRETVPHGFDEIPLVTKRGEVAWNDVQGLIEAFEILYNIYLVVQKRHGWGILYIRGKLSESVKRLAGSIILNDTSIDGNGSAEFKTPPSPEGTIETLQSIFEHIQIGSSTTFLLPKDVKTAGDISALAIMLTQSLDIEGATQKITDWQNFIDKCGRLFRYGLAKELVNNGENPNAVTEFARLRIGCTFKIWRPFNETEYNNMLISMKAAGIISTKTAVEKNTVSQPDEEVRLERETAQVQEPTENNPGLAGSGGTRTQITIG